MSSDVPRRLRDVLRDVLRCPEGCFQMSLEMSLDVLGDALKCPILQPHHKEHPVLGKGTIGFLLFVILVQFLYSLAGG